MTDKQWEPPKAIIRAMEHARCQSRDGNVYAHGLHDMRRALLASPLPECVEVLRRVRNIVIGAVADVDLPDFDPAENSMVKQIDALLAQLEGKEPADDRH